MTVDFHLNNGTVLLDMDVYEHISNKRIDNVPELEKILKSQEEKYISFTSKRKYVMGTVLNKEVKKWVFNFEDTDVIKDYIIDNQAIYDINIDDVASFIVENKKELLEILRELV